MGPRVCPVHLSKTVVCGKVVPCPDHQVRDDPQPPGAGDGTLDTVPPLRKRDLHALAWWLMERVLVDTDPGRRDRLAIAATLLRVLAAIGTPPSGDSAAARETGLRARALHGLPPRDAEEWALARSLFDDEALALLVSLASSHEADGRNRPDPLFRGHGRTDQVELPGRREDED